MPNLSSIRRSFRPSRTLTAVALMGALAITAGCGGGGYYDADVGEIYVANDDVVSTVYFGVIPSAAPGDYGPNLLGGPLPPFSEAYAGSFFEDFYDALGEQSDGYESFFDGEFLPAFGDITFIIDP